MLTIEEMLKIDSTLSELTETEMEELRTNLYGLAELAFDVWSSRKSGSKNPVGLFPDQPIGVSVNTWKADKKPE